MEFRLILFFLCIFIFSVSAQSPEKDLEKYKKYRERFLNTFISIGDAPGESIPIMGVIPHTNCATDYFIQYNNCNYSKPGNGMLYFGDSGIQLGNYMAVLALEIRNLKDAGQDYKNSTKELFYALKAIERIDKAAEAYFNAPAKLDGFFVRDDVPLDFHLKDGKARFKLENGEDYSCVISDGGCELDNIMNGSVMSQDQVINLFFGYTFISELIPDVKHEGKKLSDLAAEQVDRITTFLSDNKWKIKTPDKQTPKNSWGGNTIAFSYSLAKTANRITKGKFKKDYQTSWSKRRGKIIFSTFNWAHGIQAERNLWMVFASISSTGLWNPKKMTKRVLKADKYMYALAYSVLNGHQNDKRINQADILNFIRTAPWNGPCMETPNCSAPDGWKSHDRWVASDQKNGNPYGIQRDYNGLDFMLFYNLYHFLYKDELPTYILSR